MVLCDVKFNPSTAEAQRNDLLPMLTAQVKDGKGKGITFPIYYNGPYWNLLNIVNLMYFGRL